MTMHDRHVARGFSLVEILFAVVILGIGFIMVAALFPVAIGQAKSSAEQTTGARIISNAENAFQARLLHGSLTATNKLSLPVTNSGINPPGFPRVYLFDDPRMPSNNATDPDVIWQQCVEGLCLTSATPNAAWTGLYARGGTVVAPIVPDGTITLYSFSLADRNTSQFTAADLTENPPPPPPAANTGSAATATQLPNVCARPLEIVSLTKGPPDTIALQTVSTGPLAALSASENAIGSAVEGAYVVISDDNATGTMNGRMYRLAAGQGGGTFQLDPAMGMSNTDTNMAAGTSGRIAFVVGAGFTDPAGNFTASGASMVTGFRVTTVPLAD